MSMFARFRFWKPMAFLLAVLVAAVAVLQVNLARPAQALGLSAFSARPNTMGATTQISFQVTNQSANTAEEIRVDFLANTFGLPQTIPATTVTVNGETVQSVAIAGATRVTIFLVATGIPPGGTATVTFAPAAGITNPTLPGNYTLSVSTEEEATPLASAALSIVGQVQNLTVTLTPTTTGAMDVTALLTFRVAQNTASGAAVSIGFSAEPNAAAPNEFTVPTTVTAAQVQVRAGATAAEAANAQPLSPGGVAVTDGDNIVTLSVTLPSGVDVDGTPNLVETGRFIAVRFLPAAGIDSPTSPGTFPLTVSTSLDTAPTTSSVTLGAQAPSAQADLSVTKNASPDPVTLGNNLTYTITVTNNGPEAATGVTLTDTLLGSFTLVSATPSQGSCSGTSAITCSLGNLAKDASGAVAIVVTPTTEGDIINIALVKGAEADSKLVNNLAIERTRVKVAKQEDTRSKIEFAGFVQSLPQTGHLGTWKVQGLTVNVDGATEIKGAPQVGSFVKVKGILTAEGLIQAKELKVEERDRDVRPRGDDHRPGFGLGDSNHKHQGPPGLSDKDGSEKDPRDSVQTPQNRKRSDDNHRPGKGSAGKGHGKGKGKHRGD